MNKAKTEPDKLTRRQLRRWARRAWQHWSEHVGRYSVRYSIVATRQHHSPLHVQRVYDFMFSKDGGP